MRSCSIKAARLLGLRKPGNYFLKKAPTYMFDTYLPLLLILPLTYRKESGSMQKSVVYFFFCYSLEQFPDNGYRC